MPIVNRKRRAPQADDESEGSGSNSDAQVEQQRRRKRVSRSPESEEYADVDGLTQTNASSQEQMVKKLVRLALSCEYARQPIRRADISAKVLSHSRQFKTVFEEAQLTLKDTFGMEMVELPVKEKVTIQQRRAAQKSEKTATSSKSWVLQSTLPDKYQDPDIIPPPQIPSAETEGAYVGLYTFIISVIYLAGGTLPEAKLERYLKRTNTEHSTPIDKTDKLIARLIREGYIVKIKDNSSGEEIVEYMVGPRGKVEVGEEGVAGLVQTVYGDEAPDDLEKRLNRSLGLSEKGEAPAAPVRNGANGSSSKRPGRPKTREDDDEEEEEEESSGDDEEE